MKKSQDQTNTGSGFAELSFGWDIGLCLLVAVVAALLMPLDDADLPMHLRTGAWILDHGRLPLTEPFAWTRMGAPFFAYSWLPEVAYEGARRAWGLRGVSVVHAVAVAGAVAAVWDLARAARWSAWATRLMLSVHVILWLLVQPATRPQLVLAIALPMAWAAAYRVGGAVSPVRGIVMAVLAAALAVNSHLLFLLTIVPVVVLFGAERFRVGRAVGFIVATLGGWLCSPYAWQLLDILRLNFAYNALFSAGSPIMEHEGGFSFLTHAAVGTRSIAAFLFIIPLLGFFARLPRRARWWYGLAWLAGLGLFGLAIRGLLLWWLLALPLTAMALASIPLPELPLTKRLVIVSWVVMLLGLVGQSNKARRLMPVALPLPHPESVALAPAVRWITCALAGSPVTARDAWSARGTTIFNFGSLLAWSVPQVSWSMDGRTIFPDSVALAEAPQPLLRGRIAHPPWRTSDLVILPATHLTGTLIDADSGWVRVPLIAIDSTVPARLWVRRAWMMQAPNAASCTSVQP